MERNEEVGRGEEGWRGLHRVLRGWVADAVGMWHGVVRARAAKEGNMGRESSQWTECDG